MKLTGAFRDLHERAQWTQQQTSDTHNPRKAKVQNVDLLTGP